MYNFTKTPKLAVTAFAALSIATAADAAPLDWFFSDIQTTTGETLTGGFTFDADTVSYSNISATLSGGALQEDLTFNSLDPVAVSRGSVRDRGFLFLIDEANEPGDSFVTFSLSGPMTNSGGFVSLAPTPPFVPSGSGSCALTSPQSPLCQPVTFSLVFDNSIATAGVSTTAPPSAVVPLPATGVLLGSLLAGLGLFGRRRRKVA